MADLIAFYKASTQKVDETGDKWTRLYAEGYAPPVTLAPTFTPAAAPVLIGHADAPTAPVLTLGATQPLGGGIVANSPKRPDEGIAAGGGAGGTVGATGAPTEVAQLYQGPSIEAAPAPGAGFTWPRGIAVGVIATLIVSGLFIAFGKRKRTGA